MGYRDQVRMNGLMLSNVSYVPDQWYRIDVLFDWSATKAAFFVDGAYAATTMFYSFERDEQKSCDKTFINALMLYTLSPGETSTFKEIRLCPDLCPGTQEGDFPLHKPLTGSDDSSDPAALEIYPDPFVTLRELPMLSAPGPMAISLALATTLSLMLLS